MCRHHPAALVLKRAQQKGSSIAEFPVALFSFFLVLFPMINLIGFTCGAATCWLFTTQVASRAASSPDFTTARNSATSLATNMLGTGMATFAHVLPATGNGGVDLYIDVTNYHSESNLCYGPNTPVPPPVDTTNNIYQIEAQGIYDIGPFVNLSALPFIGQVPIIGRPARLHFNVTRALEYPLGFEGPGNLANNNAGGNGGAGGSNPNGINAGWNYPVGVSTGGSNSGSKPGSAGSNGTAISNATIIASSGGITVFQDPNGNRIIMWPDGSTTAVTGPGTITGPNGQTATVSSTMGISFGTGSASNGGIAFGSGNADGVGAVSYGNGNASSTNSGTAIAYGNGNATANGGTAISYGTGDVSSSGNSSSTASGSGNANSSGSGVSISTGNGNTTSSGSGSATSTSSGNAASNGSSTANTSGTGNATAGVGGAAGNGTNGGNGGNAVTTGSGNATAGNGGAGGTTNPINGGNGGSAVTTGSNNANAGNGASGNAGGATGNSVTIN